MIVKGYTETGLQIMQTHGGIVIETESDRDERLKEVRLNKIRSAATELLACTRLALCVMEGLNLGNTELAKDCSAAIAKATL